MISKLNTLLVLLIFFSSANAQNTYLSQETRGVLQRYKLSPDLTDISKVTTYTPGFDFQGFRFYKRKKLLVTVMVRIRSPWKYPSYRAPNETKTFCINENECNCIEWKEKDLYSGECHLKYTYSKKYEGYFYALTTFSDLSLEDKKIAHKLLQSICCEQEMPVEIMSPLSSRK